MQGLGVGDRGHKVSRLSHRVILSAAGRSERIVGAVVPQESDVEASLMSVDQEIVFAERPQDPIVLQERARFLLQRRKVGRPIGLDEHGVAVHVDGDVQPDQPVE